ncbi:manganese efflux pump MntP family protein [Phormidium yuhuli AB48]|uniref:Putative manganese efflux pump MntP n=1 Tax=Phormidium yuhuli AB48 TaxID=2940671 RepID=A0ABY5AJZ4_9CYAN|nr:manganese efflux pump MntP family protein [Phormidium yuhuli]USR89517.1 manganese efflux pump MntP family protein [Phormidium yuhuli AB48]
MLGLGLAADAFAVSLTSGLYIRHLKLQKALKVAIAFGIFQAIMPLMGWGMGVGFRDYIIRYDHWVGFILLGILGARMIHEAISQDEETEPFNPMKWETLVFMAVATSIDALAAGLGLAVLQTPILFTVAVIGVITFWLCLGGVYIGHHFGDRFQDKVEILGGLILIAIAIRILWEGLA